MTPDHDFLEFRRTGGSDALGRVFDATAPHLLLLAARLAPAGARIDAIFFAPDPPWAVTDRRKPGPGMLREAMRQFRATPEETLFIGDAVTDMQAAAAAGCRRILVRTGKGKKTQAAGLPDSVLPVTIAESLPDAVARLLDEQTETPKS